MPRLKQSSSTSIDTHQLQLIDWDTRVGFPFLQPGPLRASSVFCLLLSIPSGNLCSELACQNDQHALLILTLFFISAWEQAFCGRAQPVAFPTSAVCCVSQVQETEEEEAARLERFAKELEEGGKQPEQTGA